jgi:hypothetical protein
VQSLPPNALGTTSFDDLKNQAIAKCEAAKYSDYRDNYAVSLTHDKAIAMWQLFSQWRGFSANWKPDICIVAFKTSNGHYLTAEWGGGREISAAYTNLGDYSKFYMIQFDDVRRLFVTYSGNTIWADGGGGAGVSARNWGAGEWEAMAIVPVGSKVGLKLASGYYLSAVGGGGGEVNASAQHLQESEKFELVRL